MITWEIKKVNDVFCNFRKYFLPNKQKRLEWFIKCFPELLKYFESGKKEYENTDYFQYLLVNRKGRRKIESARNELQRELRIFLSIKENGLIHPVDIVIIKKQQTLIRGYRRICDLYHLKRDFVPCRLFSSIDCFHKIKPTVSWV